MSTTWITAAMVPFVWLATAQPLTKDEIIDKLADDPAAVRREEAKRAREALPPEVMAMRSKAREIVKTVTDEQMAAFKSDDPLLLAIYAERVRLVEDGSVEWARVIDRDIRHREEGQRLIKQVFLYDSQPGERFYVLNWLDRHPDVEFADELMEEAIRLYRADPSKWDHPSRGILSRLVAGRGNASHLAFFDELEKAGVGEGNERLYLENRLAKMKEKKAAPNAPVPPEAQPPSSQEKRQGKASGSQQGGKQNFAVLWLGWAAVAVAAAGLLWFVLKGRAHGGDRKY